MLLNKPSWNLLLIIIIVVSYTFSAMAQPKILEPIEVSNNRVLVKVTGVLDVKQLQVTINDERADIIAGSTVTTSDSLHAFGVEIPLGITPGPAVLSIAHENKIIGSQTINIPHPMPAPGKQPEILELIPIGGVEGATITIVGKNLGDNLNQVTVWLEKWQEKEGKKVLTKICEPIVPLLISSPDVQNQNKQEIKFIIPSGQNLAGQHFFSNSSQLRVIVSGQPSNYLSLRVAASDWRIKTAALAGVLIIVLLGLLALVVKRWNFLKITFIEKKTNTYSLSKCQAFAWTVVLIGSYFYLAIGKGIILGRGAIPDFNASLLGLMLISYGGMVTARGISVRRPKNDLEGSPCGLNNLISEGGEISLPRLQLLGFTITVILIYVYNLSSADLFIKGLPDVPPTLLGLLGISQTGYIGDKAVGGRLAVNYVVPRKAQLGKENIKLTITGSGFAANLKVLFQGHPELIDAQFLNANSMTVTLPKLTQPGWKQMVLIPPSGSSFMIDEIIEVVDAKIEKVERIPSNPRQIKVTLHGFNIQEVQATIADKPATAVVTDKVNNVLTLRADADIKPNDTIKITSMDGQLEAESKAP